MYVENGEQLSLKELVERRDRVGEKTGHYWGAFSNTSGASLDRNHSRIVY